MLVTRPSTRTEPASVESLLPTVIWLCTASSVLIAVAYCWINDQAREGGCWSPRRGWRAGCDRGDRRLDILLHQR